jgi:hypothetical protein
LAFVGAGYSASLEGMKQTTKLEAIEMDARGELSSEVMEQLKTSWLRVQNIPAAKRLWERCFTVAECDRLGGDFKAAYRQGGAVGMWMRLHGCSDVRATIEVARLLNFLDDPTAHWLLRETGEITDDPEEALELALQRADLVIVSSPRAMYWQKQQIPIDWTRRQALWNYFVTLCEQAKKGLPVDASDFGEHHSPNHHTKQKSRLTREKGFPLDLAVKIIGGNGGQQRLELEPQRIVILEQIRHDRISERC